MNIEKMTAVGKLTAALLPDGFSFTGVTYNAFQSAYTFTFQRGDASYDYRAGWDFARRMSESEAAEKLAREFLNDHAEQLAQVSVSAVVESPPPDDKKLPVKSTKGKK